MIVVLVVLNGFFAMAEMALVRAKRARLQAKAEAGDAGAAAALDLQGNPSRFLSTVQIGITLVGIVAGAYGGATLSEPMQRLLEPVIGHYAQYIAFGVVIVLITWLSLVVGELVPKRMALQFADGIAAFVARPMRILAMAMAPVVWLLERSTNGLLRLLRLPQEMREVPTEEEVQLLIEESRSAGVIEQEAGKMMEGLLRIADIPVRAVMTPRFEVQSLSAELTVAEAVRQVQAVQRSRFPVIDAEGEVLGILQSRDLLGVVADERPVRDVVALVDPPVVPDTRDTARLVTLFKDATVHMAIVVDEYGNFEGIVTPSDLLEAIAGDMGEAGAEDAYEAFRREDGSWLVDGLMPVHDVEHTLGIQGLDVDERYQRLAGFVLSQLGRIPKPGDAFAWRGWRFEVVDMDGRRIDKVLVSQAYTDTPATANVTG